MGLLDQKKRLMDLILTDEGRRQLGTGKFVPAYYSFSDASAVYSPMDTFVSGTAPTDNIATLITFEAFPLPQDQVSYEADDTGALAVMGNNNYFSSSQGTIRVISGQLVKGWEQGTPAVLSASNAFTSLATSIINDSANNFRKLMILKSPDLLYTNRDEFKLSTTSSQFRLFDNMMPGYVEIGQLDATEALYNDRRLSHVDNFKLLPPINKRSPNTVTSSLGDYRSAINGNKQIITYSDLKNEFLNNVVQNGTVTESRPLQKQTVYFNETSITNRIVGQMFEIGDGYITKLDVIDFGVFTIRKTDPALFPDEPQPQPLNPDVVTNTTRIHVYFVGKVMKDSTGTDKYFNICTLVFQ
jgi:hypothetical protein